MAINLGGIQKVGRSFMLPIALLPAAGILLGIGGALSNPHTIVAYPALDVKILQDIFKIISSAGGVVFSNLPLLFAISIPVGMAKSEAGTAALAGAITFLIMHATINQLLAIKGVTFSDADMTTKFYDVVLGIKTLQMGVFGGIIAGGVAVALHNRFYKISLPAILGFFGGPRFVPIISAFCALFVGAICFFIWPWIQLHIIANLGTLVNKSGIFGTLIYGMIERALIPFGLHHIFYMPFWQTSLGGTMEVCGHTVTGAQNIFFAQLGCPTVEHFEVTKGTRFMAGKFPFMIFGLPGAALAMYVTAKPERKKAVGALVLSAAVTAMLTGITEPIEFSFLFVAPFLYAIHVVYAGISFMLMDILKVGVGQTFSGGLIDLTLFGILQGTAKSNWLMVIVVGVPYFFLYFFTFSILIKTMNLKTPGREDDGVETKLHSKADYNEKKSDGGATGGNVTVADANAQQTQNVISALGGLENITSVDACITRLRVTIKDKEKVADDATWKSYGAMGVVRLGSNGIQAIYGGRAAILKVEIVEFAKTQGVDFG